MWVIYVIAYQPWSRGVFLVFRPGLLEMAPALFVKFGAHVAGACGFDPWHFGAVQFLSGLAALLIAVRLPFWIFRR